MKLTVNVEQQLLYILSVFLIMFFPCFLIIFAIQVVNETLRVANIIGGIFRRATTDIDIKGNHNKKVVEFGLWKNAHCNLVRTKFECFTCNRLHYS